MPEFDVAVIIENKPGIADPEGDTILNDLVLKGNYSQITKIKSAKMLKFRISESDKSAAEQKVRHICDEMRIFNPMVSAITVSVSEP